MILPFSCGSVKDQGHPWAKRLVTTHSFAISASSVPGILGPWPGLQSNPSTLCSGSESCQGWKKKNLILGILDYVSVKSWPFSETIDILIRLKESRITTLHILWHACSTANWIQPGMNMIKWLIDSEKGQPANWRKTEIFQENITSNASDCVDKLCVAESQWVFFKKLFLLNFYTNFTFWRKMLRFIAMWEILMSLFIVNIFGALMICQVPC